MQIMMKNENFKFEPSIQTLTFDLRDPKNIPATPMLLQSHNKIQTTQDE